jgi:DnaJ-class molecular chaperone
MRKSTVLEQDLILRQALSLLELTLPVTQEQLKARYRELAKLYHPDLGGDETTFAGIVKAVGVVSLHVTTEPVAAKCLSCGGEKYVIITNGIHSMRMLCSMCLGAGVIT